MKNREVIEKLLAYHPKFPESYQGCDNWKCGDPEAECTGVVSALTPSVNVIRKAIELGANLLVVHEPWNYTSEDGPGWFESFPNGVYDEKKTLLDEYGIAVWRDHDHMHAHDPDQIFTGVLKYCGWLGHERVDRNTGSFAHYIVDIPETTLEGLSRYLIDTIGLNGVRIVGDTKMPVKKVAFVGHLFPGGKEGPDQQYSVRVIRVLEEEADVIIPGEVIDWTVLSYVRDAMQLGIPKGVVNLGHFNWEELGMKHMKDVLDELLEGKVPVSYVPSEDMYGFITKEE